MTSSNRQLVIGIGEVLWDCFSGGRRPGGAPANVVYHTGKLGHRGVLCSRIGVDPPGDELERTLSERGIGLELLQRDEILPTGRATVDTSDPSDPRFEIHADVAWESIEATPELEAHARRSSAVVVGTLAQRSLRTRDTIRRCLDLAEGAWTVYDVNLRPPHYRKDWIESTLRRSRIAKLGESEVIELAGLLELPSGTVEFARSLFDRYGVELACITRGAEGCVVVSADEVHEEPGHPVRVVDSVGAGDAFTAGFISGLLRGWATRDAARLANGLGAMVASRSGAMPDLDDAIPELLSRVAEQRGA